ncbi:MAG: alpha/beta hydrolase [Hyphomicrobium sp.]
MKIAAVLKLLLIVAVVTYAAVMAAMYVLQRRLIYVADPTRTQPADVGLTGVIERVLETPDGEKIITWYGKAQPGQPTILYFHGNGGALEIRRDRIRKYLDRGRGMLMMAYRGYSGSTGTPTEPSNVADALLAYDTLIGDGIAAGDIIIYGESLGAAVGIQVAAARPVRALVLDSPFTSLLERAKLSYPWLPVRLLLKDWYMSRDHIKRVTVPVFVLHGELDEVTPATMGRALFAEANAPKEIVVLPGAGHNDQYLFGSFEAINAWIDRVWRGEIAAPEVK